MSLKIVRFFVVFLSVLGIVAVFLAKIPSLPLSIFLYLTFLIIFVASFIFRDNSSNSSEESSFVVPPATGNTNAVTSAWSVPRNIDEAYAAMRTQAEELEKFKKSYNDERQKNNTIREIAHEISVQKDISELFRVVLERLRAEFSCHCAFVMNIENGVLKLKYSDGVVTDMTLKVLELSGLMEPLLKKGVAVRLGEKDKDLILQAMAGSHDRINNLLCVPMKTQNDASAFGLIGLANYMMGGDFTPEMEEFLSLIGIEVAISIRNLGYINELERNYEETMLCLAQALEGRDEYTHGHVDRVRDFSERLAIEMGLAEEEVKLIRRAATLHDVGKIATPDNILHKQSPLTQEEWMEMRKHASMSAKILEPIKSLPREVIMMVLYHHERWDGKGYPKGLSSTSIPRGAQIIAVADAFDAMTSDRPYRKGMDFRVAIEKLKNESVGTQFDPEVVNAFIRMMERRVDRLEVKSEGQKPPRIQQIVLPSKST